jgi:hypothetical protein
MSRVIRRRPLHGDADRCQHGRNATTAEARLPDIVSPRSSAPAQPSTLPGEAMLQRVRRLLGWALGAGFAYSLIGGASKSSCPGAVTGDGGYLDAAGQPTDVAQLCVMPPLLVEAEAREHRVDGVLIRPPADAIHPLGQRTLLGEQAGHPGIRHRLGQRVADLVESGLRLVHLGEVGAQRRVGALLAVEPGELREVPDRRAEGHVEGAA